MKDRLLYALGDIDQALIRDAAPGISKKPRRKPRLAALVASLMILLIGAGTLTAAEAAEYRRAISFFEENALSSEGLSRSEIKRVFRDITANSFTHGKTAEVIFDSINGTISGYELPAADPTPEELVIIWMNRNRPDQLREYLTATDSTDTHYFYYSGDALSEETDGLKRGTAYFEKYENGSLSWRLSFPAADIYGYRTKEEELFIYGKNRLVTDPNVQYRYSFVAKADANGNILWHKELKDRGDREDICAVAPTASGLSVFSTYRGSLRVTRFDTDGQQLDIIETDLGDSRQLCNAAALGDGYLLQVKEPGDSSLYYTRYVGHARLVKMDADGNLSHEISYESDDRLYYIDDMIEHNGSVWISAHTIPRDGDADRFPSLSALGHVLRTYLDANPQGNNTASGALEDTVDPARTEYARTQYEAVLLRCDPTDGTPRDFYSVGGAFGGTLSVKNGSLVWEVNSISAIIMPAAIASYIPYGTCHVHRYTFDESGSPSSIEKTTVPAYLE